MDLKRIFPILLILFTNILGAGVILPILPLYAEGQFGGTVPQITLLLASFFTAQFLAAPWLGRLSDRYGRRPILIISQLGTVLAFVIFIGAGPIGRAIDGLGLALPISGGMLVLFAARILDGITGGNITTAQAYVSDLTTEEERARGLGYLQAAFGMGFIFGPAFGGVLSIYGPVVPFIGAAVITSGTLLLTTLILDESLDESERGEQASRARPRFSLSVLTAQPAIALILAIGFTASLAFSSMPATFALFADHALFAGVPDPDRIQLYIGLMLAFFGLMTVVTQIFLLPRLVLAFGERKLLLLGQIGLALSFFGLGASGAAWMATLFLAPFAFGQGISEPSIQSLVTRYGEGNLRGQMLGFYQSARSLALILGPIVAGFVFDAVSPRAVYWGGSALMGVAFLLGLRLLRQPEPARPPRAAPQTVERMA